MFKILRRSLMLALLLTAFLAISPTALATPTLVSGIGEAAKYATTLSDSSVVTITNNYNAADVIEINLPASTTAASNITYWVFLPGSTDKSAQLGSITIKKGAASGRLSVAIGKFSDFNAGSVNIILGGNPEPCEYGKAADTTAIATSNVSLRNSATGAELLIVDGSVVKKGMTVLAIVNGKMYKGTGRADGVELQVTLGKDIEVGTSVWYTIYAVGCKDIGYRELTLGTVETSTAVAPANIKLFFQGDGVSTSSIVVTGVNPGDTIYCYNGVTNAEMKRTTVPANSTMVIITGLKLTAGGSVDITRVEKGKKESTAENISVPTTAVPVALKSTAVTVSNALTGGSSAAEATVKVKNVTVGDTVTIYNANGVRIDDVTAAFDPTATEVEVEISNLDLGSTSTSIYLSVTSTNGESAWLKVTVPVAK